LKNLERTRINQALLKQRFGPPEPLPAPEEEGQELAASIVRTYAANLKILESLGESFGVPLLFYWQPVVFSKIRPSRYEELILNMWADPGKLFRKTYDQVRESMALAAIHGFRDISGVFDDHSETIFIDFCHVTEESNEWVGRRMARDVLPLLKK
jgi:hypothetical protein